MAEAAAEAPRHEATRQVNGSAMQDEVAQLLALLIELNGGPPIAAFVQRVYRIDALVSSTMQSARLELLRSTDDLLDGYTSGSSDTLVCKD